MQYRRFLRYMNLSWETVATTQYTQNPLAQIIAMKVRKLKCAPYQAAALTRVVIDPDTGLVAGTIRPARVHPTTVVPSGNDGKVLAMTPATT